MDGIPVIASISLATPFKSVPMTVGTGLPKTAINFGFILPAASAASLINFSSFPKIASICLSPEQYTAEDEPNHLGSSKLV